MPGPHAGPAPLDAAGHVVGVALTGALAADPIAATVAACLQVALALHERYKLWRSVAPAMAALSARLGRVAPCLQGLSPEQVAAHAATITHLRVVLDSADKLEKQLAAEAKPSGGGAGVAEWLVRKVRTVLSVCKAGTNAGAIADLTTALDAALGDLQFEVVLAMGRSNEALRGELAAMERSTAALRGEMDARFDRIESLLVDAQLERAERERTERAQVAQLLQQSSAAVVTAQALFGLVSELRGELGEPGELARLLALLLSSSRRSEDALAAASAGWGAALGAAVDGAAAAVASAPPALDQVTATIAAQPLPEPSGGWTAVPLPDGEGVYFWHQPSGAVQRERPTAEEIALAVAEQVQREAAAAAAAEAAAAAAAVEAAAAAAAEAAAAAAAEAQRWAERPLPVPSGGWAMLRDERGTAYFYNSRTGVTQWERPSDEDIDRSARDMAAEEEGQRATSAATEAAAEQAMRDKAEARMAAKRAEAERAIAELAAAARLRQLALELRAREEQEAAELAAAVARAAAEFQAAEDRKAAELRAAKSMRRLATEAELAAAKAQHDREREEEQRRHAANKAAAAAAALAAEVERKRAAEEEAERQRAARAAEKAAEDRAAADRAAKEAETRRRAALPPPGPANLHAAAAAGNVEEVRRLLDREAAIDAQTKDGETPLHRAAYNGRTAVVALLLDCGAAIETQTKVSEISHYRARGGVGVHRQGVCCVCGVCVHNG